MIKISENMADAFQRPKDVDWVERHVRELRELAPKEIVAAFFNQQM